MAEYNFISVWKIAAPLREVGDAIADVHSWPQWWKAVESVTVVTEGQGPLNIGAIYHHVWKSPIPYSIEFDIELTEIIPYQRLVGKSTGDLVGEGIWTLHYADGITTVTYEWKVRTTKAWMNVIAPLARPIFTWAHHWVMRQGELGLQKALSARPTQKVAADTN